MKERKGMKEIFSSLKKALEKGETTCLATITAASGAIPRGQGARMLIGASGRLSGTVGGGAVEFHAMELAQAAIAKAQQDPAQGISDFVHEFKLKHNQVEDIGMVCGGDVKIHFQILRPSPQLTELCERALGCFAEGQAAWLLQDFSQEAKFPLLLWQPEQGLPDAAFNAAEKQTLNDFLNSHRPEKGLLHFVQHELFIEELFPLSTVYVMGGGHVAQALVPALAAVHFSVMVLEDREEFLRKELFPEAREVRKVNFSRILDFIEIKPEDYVCIMTRGHHYDEELLRQILQTPARYIGAIGSMNKRRYVDERLLASGVNVQQLARIHSPIGLPIGGETPAEIAVSITAELISERWKLGGKGRKEEYFLNLEAED